MRFEKKTKNGTSEKVKVTKEVQKSMKNIMFGKTIFQKEKAYPEILENHDLGKNRTYENIGGTEKFWKNMTLGKKT